MNAAVTLTVADPGFPGPETANPKLLFSQFFPKKLYENGKILGGEKKVRPLRTR